MNWFYGECVPTSLLNEDMYCKLLIKWGQHWVWWNNISDRWRGSDHFCQQDITNFIDEDGDKLISKEEDLEMNKQYKSVYDLPIGMFVKYKGRTGYGIYLIINELKSCSIPDGVLTPIEFFIKDEPEAFSYSTTYDGEYTPFVVESETDKMIKELEATVALAQGQMEFAQKQIQKLKGVK